MNSLVTKVVVVGLFLIPSVMNTALADEAALSSVYTSLHCHTLFQTVDCQRLVVLSH